MSSQKQPVAAKSLQAPANPTFQDRLKPYGLSGPAALAIALGVSRQHAHMILTGKRSPSSRRPYRIGIPIAKRIGALVGLPFTLILEWQENGR